MLQFLVFWTLSPLLAASLVPLALVQPCLPLADPPAQEDLARSHERVRADPDDAFAWNDLGETLVRACRLQEAAEAYARARELGLRAADRHLRLGRVYFEAGDWHRALLEYEHLVALDPARWGIRPDVGLNLAVTYARVGRPAHAVQPLTWVLSANPDDPRAFRLVERLLKAEAPLPALVLEATAAMPRDDALGVGGVILAGLAHLKMDHWDQAIAEFGRALTLLRPHGGRESVLYAYLGRALLEKGTLAEAQAALQIAITRRDWFPDGHFWLGRVYYARGQTVLAIESWRRALQQDPEHEEARAWLQRVSGR
ncbi:MAG: tetratricopeptide repeat protein [bacterium]|nr:tetratricopeptide repeat protein [bacterium]